MLSPLFEKPLIKYSCFAAILFLCIFLAWPKLNRSMPFFDDEDEAHHFNRIVNMIKNRDLNPHYFHKPSLHFYLRMPVVLGSYLWEKSQNRLRYFAEIKTQNEFGLAKYNFTASNPQIVISNRAFSLLLGIGCLIFCYLICQNILSSTLLSLVSCLIIALSPPFIEYSTLIAVDIVMSFFCLLTVYLALRFFDNLNEPKLILVGLISGLAISSKYNAAPIAAIPLILAYFSPKKVAERWIISIFTPVLGFFAASPYILTSLDLFYQQLSYEVWHYAVAGHVGHQANPGIAQASFYSNWLINEALGLGIIILAICGIFIIFLKNKTNPKLLILVTFPILYFSLMSLQKANFVRNMLVLIPFLSILSIYFLDFASTKSNKNLMAKVGLGIISIFSIFKVTNLTYAYQNLIRQEQVDSRLDLLAWLKQTPEVANSKLGIAGRLQVPQEIFSRTNANEFDAKNLNFDQAWLMGFDKIIVDSEFATPEQLPQGVSLIKSFSGNNQRQRIVLNPEIKVFNLKNFIIEKNRLTPILKTLKYAEIQITDPIDYSNCYKFNDSLEIVGDENYCWIRTRIAKIYLPLEQVKLKKQRGVNISFEAFSPWPQAQISLLSSEKQTTSDTQLNQNEVDTWRKFEFKNLEIDKDNSILIQIDQINSPCLRGKNPDCRRLGIAIRNFEIN